MKAEKFNGCGSVDTFLAKFAICAKYNCWSEEDKASQLQMSLTDSAGQLLWDSGKTTEMSYQVLVEKLRRRYGSVDQQEKYQAELRARRRRRDETLEELQQDIRRLMTKSYPDEGDSKLGDTMAKDYFIAALDDPSLELKVREQEPRNLEAACKHAVRFEVYQKTMEGRSVREPPRNRGTRGVDDMQSRRVEGCHEAPTQPHVIPKYETPRASIQSEVSATDRELRQKIQALKRERDDLSKVVGRYQSLNQQPPPSGSVGPPFVPLDNPVTTAVHNEESAHVAVMSSPRSPTCYRCGGLGHIASQCRARRADSQQGAPTHSQVPQPPKIVAVATTDQMDSTVREVYIELTVGGKACRCLLDTGSEVTLIPTRFVDGLRIEPTIHRLLAANRTIIPISGMCTIFASNDRHCFPIEGYVSDHIDELMIGIDWLKSHNAVWDFGKAEIELDGEVHRLCGKPGSGSCHRVVLQDQTPISSETPVQSKVMFSDINATSYEFCITEPTELRPNRYVARTSIGSAPSDVSVRLTKYVCKPMMLQQCVSEFCAGNTRRVNAVRVVEGKAGSKEPIEEVVLHNGDSLSRLYCDKPSPCI